jgi:hypothetical protein
MPKREHLIGRHERDRLIVALSAKGWSDSKIGHYVGLSRRGVGMARQRILEGRPAREGDPLPPGCQRGLVRKPTSLPLQPVG